MIQSVHLRVHARNERDSKLLSRLLTSLGIQSQEHVGDQKNRSRLLFPPAAALEIVHRGNAERHSDLHLIVSDPDSAADVVAGMGLEITNSAGSGPAARHFRVRLPGGTTVTITGFRLMRQTGLQASALEGGLSAKGLRFAIVASRFNSFIVERLLLGALDGLRRSGAGSEAIAIVRVPGSFEIPSAARRLAQSRRYDAIICLGCLLRGDTAHYDVIVHEVTRGIGQSAQETGVPHAFGVLTCDTLEQAIDRAGLKMGNKGFEAALAAIEMSTLNQAVGKKRARGAKTARPSRAKDGTRRPPAVAGTKSSGGRKDLG